jgi:hypothetical protein
VTRIDPGVVSLFAELRGHGRQAAEELGQGKTRGEERKPLDVLAPAKACRWFASGFPRLRKPSSGRDRPRNPQPQLPRRGAPKALGPAARRPRPDLAAAGRGDGRSARRRQRVAGARLQGQESRPAGDAHDPGVVSLLAELLVSGRPPRNWSGGRRVWLNAVVCSRAHEQRKTISSARSPSKSGAATPGLRRGGQRKE